MITPAELARVKGVSQGHLSAIERGQKEAGVEFLLRISRHSHRSLDWLVTREESN